MNWIKYSFGDLLEQTHEENSDLKYGSEDVRGMTITKEIIDTKARTEYADLQKFIIVHPKEFIYNPRTHGKKIGLGYNNTDKSFLISWNNIAFKIKDEAINIVDPEYLYLHFIRPEWDREACYRALGSSTEVFAWETFERMTVFLPTLEEQKNVVKKIKVITDRIKVLTDINQKLEEIANILYQDFIKKIKCDYVSIFNVAKIKYGKGLQKQDLTQSGYHVFGGNGIIGYYTDYLYEEPQILISCRGAASGNILESLPYSYVTSNSLIVELANRKYYEFIKRFLILHPLHAYTTGSAQPQITIDNLAPLKLPYPTESDIDQINQNLQPIADYKLKVVMELQKLTELKDVLLPKLMTGDVN